MTVLAFLEVCVRSVVLILLLLTGFAYMTLMERRIVAWMQWRIGPNRTGPQGVLQPLADGIKLLFKEQLIPSQVSKFVFILAPCISLVVALSTYAVIPVGLGCDYTIGGHTVSPWIIADLDVSVLYLLGVSSLGVYGIILGGWASGNKYALLGAIRSSAQVVSYELALGTALISPLMMVGSLSFLKIVDFQASHGWLILSQPLAFVLYWTAAVAEVNRAPFDLPEAEQELGAGYHTEYSGMKFSMFFMAEYVNMFTVSSVATTVFLGGPTFPFGWLHSNPLWFVGKVYIFMFFFIWLRATFPRFRYDQLMRIGWQFLLPMAFLNLAVTSVGVALNWSASMILGSIALMLCVIYFLSSASRTRHAAAVA